MNRPKNQHLVGFVVACFSASFCMAAQAAPVSYAAQLETSLHNPVTDILILEQDAEGTVHGTVYGQDITGNGFAVVNHDPAYEPVRSLVIGLTMGKDEVGDPKLELVKFLGDDFAAANQGLLYSAIFPGARHSLTIASLQAAVAGNAKEMAWFTDVFFTGPAAAAVFDTHGSFTVAEFTPLHTIGAATTVGDWTLNTAFVFIPGGQPGAQGATPTGVLDETAESPGPFDISFPVDDDGWFAVDKTVVNGTDLPMVGFTLEVGTGTGADFVPSANINIGRFDFEGSTLETTGAFPDMTWAQLGISWDGLLAPGAEAHFVFFVFTGTPGQHDVTVRQRAIYQSEGEEGRASFEVTKDFTDSNPSEVEVTINCFTGLPLQQSQSIAEGDSVNFVVTDFDAGELDCNITEAGPAGYSAIYEVAGNLGGTAGSITGDDNGCHFAEVELGQFDCQIINSPDPVDVVINKEWVFEGSSTPQDIDTTYELTLFCDGEIIGGTQLGETVEAPAGFEPDFCGIPFVTAGESGQTITPTSWCKEFNGDGPDTFTAEVIPVYPDGDCEVIETVHDSAVEVDNDCGNLVISAGHGDSCTITNTVFFEGIPTLNQYGVAILALLMLGAGLVTFRRIA